MTDVLRETLVQKLCHVFCWRSKSCEACGSVGDTHGVMGQGLRESRRSLGPGYLASFSHLCQCHDLIVVGEAATIFAMGKQLHARWRFQKRGVGDCVFFFSSRCPSLPALTPSIFPVHYPTVSMVLRRLAGIFTSPPLSTS